MRSDSCRWIAARLPLFAGTDLMGEDARRVERHVRGCAACRRRLRSLHEAQGALDLAAGHLAASDSAESLWPALQQRIREERHAPHLRLPPPWRSMAIRAAVVAGLLFTVAGAGYAMWRYSPIVIRPPAIALRRLPRPVLHPPAASPRPVSGQASPSDARRPSVESNTAEAQSLARAASAASPPIQAAAPAQ